MRSPESPAAREQALLEHLLKETLFWRDNPNKRERLIGDYPMYRALDNAKIKDLGERKKWIGRLKRELARREAADKKRSDEIRQAHRLRQIDEARELERTYPPDTYMIEEDEAA